MGGKRLSSFRSGDRSEYLANYALSRISFVNSFPRQEDFGVADFLCILAKQKGKLVYPETAFYVQVKSNSNDIVFDKDAMKWISNYMDQPLLVCVADKKTNNIKIYSCLPLWGVVFPKLTANKVTLVLDSKLPLEKPILLDDDMHWKIFLGQPILDKNIDEIEKNPDFCHSLIKEWLDIDAINIAQRKIGRISIRLAKNWETNKLISKVSNVRTMYFYAGEYKLSEYEIAPILTGLGNYLAEIEEHLDKHGKGFALGKIKIED